MSEPAHRVLTLVTGMLTMDRAQSAPNPDGDGADQDVAVDDPGRAARIAAMAAECGGEVAS